MAFSIKSAGISIDYWFRVHVVEFSNIISLHRLRLTVQYFTHGDEDLGSDKSAYS